MSKRKIKFLILFSLIFIFLSFSFVLAQDRELEVKYPDIPGTIKPETVTALLPDYLKYIFNFTIIAIGFVILGLLIRSGITYLTSAGQPTKFKEAKDQIFSAFLGLIILLSSYLILTTINPQLAIFDLPFGGITIVRCATDADCDDKDKFPGCQPPGSCVCRLQDRACVSKIEAEETSIIYYEIPIGQMIKNGVWKTSEIALMTNVAGTGLLDEFEKFLNEEIVTGGRTSKNISDLNRYLKSLLEDCRCDLLDAVCKKPEEGGGPVGCTGDPCKNVRDEIEEVLDMNSKKISDLEKHKNDLREKLRGFLDEENKFFNEQDNLSECLQEGFILSQGDYLESVRYFAKQGIETKVVQGYVPSRGDPFTFYCTVGGTMYDIPVRPSDLPPLEEGGGELPEAAAEKFEPASCPGIIPIGEILDGVGGAAALSNENLTGLVESIDGLTAEIRNMADLTSEFNEKNCEVDCDPNPNPCFPGQGVCVPIPFSASMLCCNPTSLPTCLVCWPGVNTKSPGLSTIGVCKSTKPNDKPYYGYPGPIGKTEEDLMEMSITKTAERIKTWEDMIFDLVGGLKEGFTNTPYVLETPQQLPVDLVEGVKWVMNFCKNADFENPKWAMINCSLAVGNIGPDGQTIGGCHLYDFFCCTSDKQAAAAVGRPPSTGLTYYQPPEAGGLNYYYPSVVASDGTCNGDIIAKASSYAGIPYSQGYNKSTYPSWCRMWQIGHCYPAFSKSATGEYQFGPYVPNPPPNTQGNMCLDCSGFVSRVYRDLGILPPDPVGTWCFTVATIITNREYFYEIRKEDLTKGDLITTGCGGDDARHVVIYKETLPNGRFVVWHEGGCPGGSRVCEKDRGSNGNCQRHWRRKYECGTFSQP